MFIQILLKWLNFRGKWEIKLYNENMYDEYVKESTTHWSIWEKYLPLFPYVNNNGIRVWENKSDTYITDNESIFFLRQMLVVSNVYMQIQYIGWTSTSHLLLKLFELSHAVLMSFIIYRPLSDIFSWFDRILLVRAIAIIFQKFNNRSQRFAKLEAYWKINLNSRITFK